MKRIAVNIEEMLIFICCPWTWNAHHKDNNNSINTVHCGTNQTVTLLDLDESKFVFLSTILNLNIEFTETVTCPNFCKDCILLFCVGKIRCVSINVF